MLIADLHELVDAVYPRVGGRRTRPDAGAQPAPAARTVLLAEDSDFFRAQVKRYLERGRLHGAGRRPTAKRPGSCCRRTSGKVDAVVTDIEMPRLTGLGPGAAHPRRRALRALPIIALTSLAGEDDIAKGKAAGIDDYQVKLDRDRLTGSAAVDCLGKCASA